MLLKYCLFSATSYAEKLIRQGLLILFFTFIVMPTAFADKETLVEHKIKIDFESSGLKLSEPLTGLVIPLRLHSGNFDFFDVRDDGKDLSVFSQNGHDEIPIHIERWDPLNELGLLWIKIPTLSSKDPQLTLDLQADRLKTDIQGEAEKINAKSAIYDEHHVAVLSFDGSGQHDTSIYHNDISDIPKLDQAGILGNAAALQEAPIVLPHADVLQLKNDGALTLFVWIKLSDISRPAIIYEQRAKDQGLRVEIKDGQLHVHIEAHGLPIDIVGGQIQAQTWHHLGVSIGSGRAVLYVDGQSVAQAKASLPDVNSEVRLGTGLVGLIDQVELSDEVRSSDWVHATVLAQKPDSRLITVLTDEDASSEGHNYFSILISNLTTDAWIVIALLMLMLIIAIFVMLNRVYLVKRVTRANADFLDWFQSALDGQKLAELKPKDVRELADSTLMKLYQVGFRELSRRNSGKTTKSGLRMVLSPQSIVAIRAFVDSEKTRQTHRLNARMVLLSIAISGGPFIGLLGTVMGVMITFAAIAAAGDVNINAIAPGIAAALLATVAGLSVAIPSLFAYNWLSSRIQNLVDEMDMFVDEFIPCIAEIYTI
ncbi:MotA/TolQ/ExbB proton channel family protein [Ampullimonas aquatilis]|uniref:MotA/TolQ/ExbB proton channel family protein n=1 Tax=Ampullimonas aquatilis TaxID=1341549 RepID=UPI003C74DF70